MSESIQISDLNGLKKVIESPNWMAAIQSMQSWFPELVSSIQWETRLSDHFVLHYYIDAHDEEDARFDSLLTDLETIYGELEEFFEIKTGSKQEKLALQTRLVCFVVKTRTERTFGSLTDPHILFFLYDPKKVPEYMDRFRHEVAHWVWGRVYGEAPPLFQEGVAVYAEKMSAGDRKISDFLTSSGVNIEKIPPLSEVAIGENFWKHRGMYTVGSLWVHYLVQRYGWDTLKQLFLHSDFEDPEILEHFEKVYGDKVEVIESDWKTTLKSSEASKE